MTHTQESLSGKSLEELKVIATKLNIKPHHNAKEATIIKHILQQPKAYVRDAMEHVATTPAAPVHNNTPDMVMETIKPYADKEGFEVTFPDDGTWIFKYKGAEESGNLAIPLRLIKQKAEFVARGRRAIRHMQGFEGGRTGKYTDTVIAG